MKAVVDLRIIAPFHTYGDKKRDKKALIQIKRYIEEKVKEECNFLPLHIDKDQDGHAIEDCTRKTSVKLTKAHLKKR